MPSRIAVDPAITELAAGLRLVVGRLGRRLRQAATGDLTPSLMSALSTIDGSGPLSLGELARIEGVAPPSMTRVVGKLEELGLIDRRTDPADARSSLVEVTTKGSRALAKVRSTRTAFLTERLEGLSDDERATLAAALPLLAGLLEEAP